MAEEKAKAEEAARVQAETEANRLAEEKAKAEEAAQKLAEEKLAKQLTQQSEKQSITLNNIYFQTASSAVLPESDAQLVTVANALKTHADINILITGHTDSSGKKVLNDKLSQDRAQAIKTALIQKGVAAQRISTKGMGSSQPVASNSTPEGRAQNRRIEISVVK